MRCDERVELPDGRAGNGESDAELAVPSGFWSAEALNRNLGMKSSIKV